MKNNKILSIIIPSYNVSQYICKTIDSFLVEEVINNIEIIIVNDGSKDNTLEIAKEYQIRYPESIIVIDKENGGHGSGINKGVEAATGKYFKVIDGDDWINQEVFVSFIEKLYKSDSDLIINNAVFVEDVTYKESAVIRFYDESGSVFNFDSIIEKHPDWFFGIHTYTIKTSIMKENKIRVSEKVFYEDTEYVLFPIKYVDTVEFTDLNLYMYRVANANQSISAANLFKNRRHRVVVTQSLIKYLNSINDSISKQKKYYYYYRIFKAIVAQIEIYYLNYNSDSVFDEIKEYIDYIKNDNEILFNVLNRFYFTKYKKLESSVSFNRLSLVYNFCKKIGLLRFYNKSMWKKSRQYIDSII